MRLADKVATMARRGAPLPYLRRVAYLESHGTEWIDTGMLAKDCKVIDATIMPIATSGMPYLNLYVGANNNGSRSFGIGARTSSIWTFPNTSNVVSELTAVNPITNAVHRVVYDRLTLKGSVDGTELNVQTGGDALYIPTRTLYLFAMNKSGSEPQPANCSRVRFYACKLYDADRALVRDFISVLDLSGRPVLYDEVSGQFFYNQGTGEFGWGELTAADASAANGGGGITANA